MIREYWDKLLTKIAEFKSSENAAFQGVHFCIGQMVILWADHFHMPLIWMAGLMSGFVLLLEFWYDPTYEKGQNMREDIKDTIFYFAGIWSAYGILR